MVLKNQQCLQCEYKTTRKSSLQTHIKSIHEGQKFQCPHCEHQATRKGHLMTHIKSVHEGQKFPCPHCEYRATQNENLQTHIKSVHEGQKFQCPQCEYKATWKTNLQTHIKSVHEGQKFQCPLCQHKVTRRHNLRTHIKSGHWVDISHLRYFNLSQLPFTILSPNVEYSTIHHQTSSTCLIRPRDPVYLAAGLPCLVLAELTKHKYPFVSAQDVYLFSIWGSFLLQRISAFSQLSAGKNENTILHPLVRIGRVGMDLYLCCR